MVNYIIDTTPASVVSILGHNTGANHAVRAMSKDFYFNKIKTLTILEPCFIMNLGHLYDRDNDNAFFSRESYRWVVDPLYNNDIYAIADELWRSGSNSGFQKACNATEPEKNSTACKADQYRYPNQILYPQLNVSDSQLNYPISVKLFDQLIQGSYEKKFMYARGVQEFQNNGYQGIEVTIAEGIGQTPVNVIYSTMDTLCKWEDNEFFVNEFRKVRQKQEIDFDKATKDGFAYLKTDLFYDLLTFYLDGPQGRPMKAAKMAASWAAVLAGVYLYAF